MRQAKHRGATNPAAISRATPASTTSAHPEIAPTTVRARDCTILHRTMIIPRRTMTATTATTRISIPTISAATATATATTPDRASDAQTKTAARNRAAVLFLGRKGSDHEYLRADIDAAVQIDHVLVAHPDAAG